MWLVSKDALVNLKPLGLRGYVGVILGFYWDNGEENGNYFLGKS